MTGMKGKAMPPTYDCLCYSSSSVIEWTAKNFHNCMFVTYEQVRLLLMSDVVSLIVLVFKVYPSDGFGRVMYSNYIFIAKITVCVTDFCSCVGYAISKVDLHLYRASCLIHLHLIRSRDTSHWSWLVIWLSYYYVVICAV